MIKNILTLGLNISLFIKTIQFIYNTKIGKTENFSYYQFNILYSDIIEDINTVLWRIIFIGLILYLVKKLNYILTNKITIHYSSWWFIDNFYCFFKKLILFLIANYFVYFILSIFLFYIITKCYVSSELIEHYSTILKHKFENGLFKTMWQKGNGETEGLSGTGFTIVFIIISTIILYIFTKYYINDPIIVEYNSNVNIKIHYFIMFLYSFFILKELKKVYYRMFMEELPFFKEGTPIQLFFYKCNIMVDILFYYSIILIIVIIALFFITKNKVNKGTEIKYYIFSINIMIIMLRAFLCLSIYIISLSVFYLFFNNIWVFYSETINAVNYIGIGLEWIFFLISIEYN
ncbi:unnamed protein product (mitochondrion) [Parajaminaea phylloscopi]|uniref:Ymf66 n=1 Tax=Parajaminaea phylloscopi TaxID=1463510 RepID=A0AB39A6Z9_9BASI